MLKNSYTEPNSEGHAEFRFTDVVEIRRGWDHAWILFGAELVSGVFVVLTSGEKMFISLDGWHLNEVLDSLRIATGKEIQQPKGWRGR